MNQIAKNMASYLGSASMTDEEYLKHYGVKRRSGRYPYGSGEDPYQHERDFLGRIEELKKNGWTETTENIKKEFGINSTEYRREKRIAQGERKLLQIQTAKRLRDKEGLGATDIGRRMGISESTVRGWFEGETESKLKKSRETANFLKEQVNKKKMIDVGKDVEKGLNISREQLDVALTMLKKEGYNVYSGRVPQPTNVNQSTTQKVLTIPDKKHKDIFEYDKVKTIDEFISRDGGQSYEKKFHYPTSMDSKRLQIRYKEDGGIDKDGIVELRRGVPDLSLGKDRYAQVRILVDGSHYIKGMAVYSDDMPDGIDVIFNTNKSKKVPKMEVLKEIKKDPDNPFGSAIKDSEQGGQYWYDPKTGERVSSKHPNAKLGLINKRASEGDWTEWKDSLPSQFLGKQSLQLAKKQLDLAKANKEDEFDTYKSLTNPTIKRYYLDKFASSCDAAAVDLKAAALPGQKYHVIIPINAMGEDRIYAPKYKDGTKLALIRYPHGGLFEIPILTVDNKNKVARKLLDPDIDDAVGISSKVAERLSGADFDGDTVMCIPTHGKNGKVKIANKDPLKDLVGFDNKLEYGPDLDATIKDPDGKEHYFRNGREYKVMPKDRTNLEMGIISNLITDMTLKGAGDEELAAAVKHSMVVIDAAKHKLDYTQSYIDNNIAGLKKKWQPKYDQDGNLIGSGGAATILSRSKGPKDIPKRKGQPNINQKGKDWYDPTKPEGALIYKTAPDNELYYPENKYNKKTHIRTITTTSGKTIEYNMNDRDAREKYEPIMSKDPKTGEIRFTSKDGSIDYKVRQRTTKVTNMSYEDDAMNLVSNKVHPHPMERIYADYANSMKAMANKARMEMIRTGNLQYSPTAKKIYKNEVASLEKKYNDAALNSIRERAAIRLANVEIKRKRENDPTLDRNEIKKLNQREMTRARDEVGAISRKKRAITINDREWEAIQAGAISDHKLKEILKYTDADVLRERAMPKDRKQLSDAQINRIKRLRDSDFTLAQIAEKMGISSSAVSKYLKGD